MIAAVQKVYNSLSGATQGVVDGTPFFFSFFLLSIFLFYLIVLSNTVVVALLLLGLLLLSKPVSKTPKHDTSSLSGGSLRQQVP